MPPLWKVLKEQGGRLRPMPAIEGAAKPPGDGRITPEPEGITLVTAEGAAAPAFHVVGTNPREHHKPFWRGIWPGLRKTKLARLYRFLVTAWREPNLWVDPLLYQWDKVSKKISFMYRANVTRKLSPDEAAKLAEIKRRQELARLLVTEGNLYWDRIQSTLDRWGFSHKPTKTDTGGGMRFTRHVKCKRIQCSPDAIYYRLATDKLPYGTQITALMSDELLTDISIACGRRVSGEYSPEMGAVYILERATGVRGIPRHVQLTDMMAGMPASADGLTVPLGIGENNTPVYRSFSTMYNMLVAGTVGGGKSNLLNVILCTLIRRNPPDKLKLLLVDLKGGLEFQFYEGIPHLIREVDQIPTGIAEYNWQVPTMLHWLHTEGEKRMDTMRKAGYKDIGRYNARNYTRRMPHIFMVMDELADLMYDPDIRRQSEDILANICQRFRAVGIHVIACTQVPKAEVISTRIKGVLPAKIAYPVPTNAHSITILDNGNAKGLSPVGRCIFQWNTDERQIQTPYINEQQIDKYVQGAILGNFEEAEQAGHDVTPLEVLQWSLGNDNGYLSRDRLYRQYSPRGVTIDEINQWLQDWEGTEIMVGTTLYKVDKAAGSRPRRLIAIDESEGETKVKMPATLTVTEILETALTTCDGRLSIEPLFQELRAKISRQDLGRLLRTLDNKEYTINGRVYLIDPGGGRNPRKLILIENTSRNQEGMD